MSFVCVFSNYLSLLCLHNCFLLTFLNGKCNKLKAIAVLFIIPRIIVNDKNDCCSRVWRKIRTKKWNTHCHLEERFIIWLFTKEELSRIRTGEGKAKTALNKIHPDWCELNSRRPYYILAYKNFKKERETRTYKCILFAESWLRRKWLLQPNLYFSSWRGDERYELEKNQLEQHIGNFLLLLLISIGLGLLSSDWLKTKTKTIYSSGIPRLQQTQTAQWTNQNSTPLPRCLQFIQESKLW